MAAYEIQIFSGKLIAKYRRDLGHCLYCETSDLTSEHIVPEAVGGRLTADILCGRHNGAVNVADEPLNKNFAPYVTMLQVPRQRGGVGAEFDATDAHGSPIAIVAEGFAKQKPLIVHRRDKSNRIAHATGDLGILDTLPEAAFSLESPRNVFAVITVPEANYSVVSGSAIMGAILKIALHFFAGFVGDVAMDEANELLPYIAGEAVAGGKFVRTPFLDDDVFPEMWPPQHEVTAYPVGGLTLVTILLFGAYGYTCRLPFTMRGTTGLRYRQALGQNYPELHEGVSIPQSLSWERRPGKNDGEAWNAPIRERLRRIAAAGAETSIRARCQRAWENALQDSANYGDMWERYRGRLGIECFSSDDIQQIVAIGRRLLNQSKDPWAVPVALPPDEPPEQTGSGA